MSVFEPKSWFWLPRAFSFGSTDACLTKADVIKNKIINCFIYQIPVFHISTCNMFSWKKYTSMLFHSVRSEVHFNPWIEIMNWTDWCWPCLLFALEYYLNREQPVSQSVKTRRRRRRKTVLRNTQIVLHSIYYICMKSNIWYQRFKPLYIRDLSRIWMIAAVKRFILFRNKQCTPETLFEKLFFEIEKIWFHDYYFNYTFHNGSVSFL